ncbi:hypothetical protein OAD49_04740 [Flavobacteriaceae bacterium]|nr:hypothetical protein [Flavobacteriaceae bacterium]
MINKENIYNLTELLLAGSVTAIGFSIGGVIGPAIMTGLGINLASSILDKGNSKLKSKWVESKDGILNHDIQRAFIRAFDKSVIEIETEYLDLDSVKDLSEENTKTIKQFFKSLKKTTEENFNSILTSILNENQIQEYLSKQPKESENLLWKRIKLDEVFKENNKHVKDYYDSYEYDNNHLKDYFRTNLHYKIKFWFSEELKTDNKENNKAWRAYQLFTSSFFCS